ncbi:hypothetical protein FOMPIDRAFT_93562 [Fomitopsis schrenkii]|uniref:Uncharacterized protein n=1 Tax=Fomitopsis schrenkii TaxID=2126942 RepID=S8DMD6_FOMSC|nr:hypothetical protein FOMPIDRAFT_93562 [Fomitopsis schrenkii]
MSPKPVPAFPLAEAQLVALFMQSVAYGVHVATFAMCMYTWFELRNTPRTSRSWPWVSVAVVLFFIGTIDVSFNLYHNLLAFVVHDGGQDAQGEFQDLSDWVDVIRSKIQSVWARLSALVSDAALICRCWIVYANLKHRWFIVALPSLLWLGATTCAVMDIVLLSTLHSSTSIPATTKLRPYLTAYYVTTLALNVLTTALIVYRIWDVHHQTTAFFRTSRLGTDRIRNAVRIFVESALLYTVAVAVSAIAELAKSNAYYGTSDTCVELAGITFDLIIIRIWRGLTAEQHPTFDRPLDRQRSTRRDVQDEASESGDRRSATVSPIVVNLKTVTVSDRDKDSP